MRKISYNFLLFNPDNLEFDISSQGSVPEAIIAFTFLDMLSSVVDPSF
jgi:hypothetical protein